MPHQDADFHSNVLHSFSAENNMNADVTVMLEKRTTRSSRASPRRLSRSLRSTYVRGGCRWRSL